MIKVFVTVGTTPFDDLIKYLDDQDWNGVEIIAQISEKATFKPKNIEWFEFCDNIDFYYKNYNVIISHAGAGSVYKLLELNKKCIFVPNTSMKDNHQEDICRFLSENNFAEILRLKNKEQKTKELIEKTVKTEFNSYTNSNSMLLATAILETIVQKK